MEKLVEYIAKALVDHPDQVTVTTACDTPQNRVIELKVISEDRGRVIGKNGRTAHALRTLLAAANRNPECQITLDIVE